jgi:hypothetical protein
MMGLNSPILPNFTKLNNIGFSKNSASRLWRLSPKKKEYRVKNKRAKE